MRRVGVDDDAVAAGRREHDRLGHARRGRCRSRRTGRGCRPSGRSSDRRPSCGSQQGRYAVSGLPDGCWIVKDGGLVAREHGSGRLEVLEAVGPARARRWGHSPPGAGSATGGERRDRAPIRRAQIDLRNPAHLMAPYPLAWSRIKAENGRSRFRGDLEREPHSPTITNAGARARVHTGRGLTELVLLRRHLHRGHVEGEGHVCAADRAAVPGDPERKRVGGGRAVWRDQ